MIISNLDVLAPYLDSFLCDAAILHYDCQFFSLKIDNSCNDQLTHTHLYHVIYQLYRDTLNIL